MKETCISVSGTVHEGQCKKLLLYIQYVRSTTVQKYPIDRSRRGGGAKVRLSGLGVRD